VAAVFGIDPWKSRHTLWLEKTGRIPPSDETSGHIERGNALEPIIQRIYRQKTGRRLLRGVRRLAHPSQAWRIGEVDAIAPGSDIGPRFRVVECKAPSLAVFRRIQREGLGFSWQLQGQHYLGLEPLGEGIGRLEVIDYVVHCADSWETVILPMEPDPIIQEAIEEEEAAFWRMVERDEYEEREPVAMDYDGMKPEDYREEAVVRTDAGFVEAAQAYREARELAKTAEDLVEAARERLVDLLGDALGRYEAPGLGRFVYAQPNPGRTFDHATLAKVAPLDPVKVQAVLAELVDTSRPDAAGVLEALGRQCRLDLDPFYKPKAPSRRLTFYPARC
jgi:predicted phage-related endonuclease